MSDYTGTFLVSTTVNGEPQPVVEVTGRTYLDVERHTRRNLNRDPRTVSFSIDLIREVVTHWNPDTGRYDMPSYRINGYQHVVEVMHR